MACCCCFFNKLNTKTLINLCTLEKANIIICLHSISFERGIIFQIFTHSKVIIEHYKRISCVFHSYWMPEGAFVQEIYICIIDVTLMMLQEIINMDKGIAIAV